MADILDLDLDEEMEEYLFTCFILGYLKEKEEENQGPSNANR